MEQKPTQSLQKFASGIINRYDKNHPDRRIKQPEKREHDLLRDFLNNLYDRMLALYVEDKEPKTLEDALEILLMKIRN